MGVEDVYHIPVLLDKSVDELVLVEDGIYIDVTFGGGGHSKQILNRLNSKGRLYAFDQDIDAMTHMISDERFDLFRSNFEFVENFMDYLGIDQVDGIIADLGVSSHHFDEAERGFSYRFEADLDMRMNAFSKQSAQSILAEYSEDQLVNIFSRYGEIRNSKTLAKIIVAERLKKSIETTSDLELVLRKCMLGDRQKYLSQVYQALRIEVNDEMGVLKKMLEVGHGLLKVGGRFVVLTYHSLEDRLVKQYFRDNNFTGNRLQDSFGRPLIDLKPVYSKPIVAGREEVRENRRATSAKLRIAEKIKMKDYG